MSLTSKELNYMIWRYLQESGLDVAAYALDKHTNCQSYEDKSNSPIISKIQPGCLVNLVQKGILFTIAESEAGGDDYSSYKEEDITFLAALVKDEIAKQKGEENRKSESERDSRFVLKSEITAEGEKDDVEMKDQEVPKFYEEENEKNLEFDTKMLSPKIKYSESVASGWHPNFDVFSYGTDNSIAIINAIKDGAIAESVTLNHPNITGMDNEINMISWAPHGSLIVTAGTNGELRAWSPDGKLKNIANTFSTNETGPQQIESTPNVISQLVWSDNGQFLLSISADNQICLWDGNNLNLLEKLNTQSSTLKESCNLETIDACWLDDFKFAVSTPKNTIKIFSVFKPQFGTGQEIQAIGTLSGHENIICFLKFNEESKLLASCSDFDYSIKIWRSSSTQEPLDLKQKSASDIDVKYHSAPIIGLFWLNKNNEGSILLSLSMEGTLNIWNAESGASIVSTNLFHNEKNYHFNETSDYDNKVEALGFNASLSPNKNLLAVGDDLGRITIWDVSLSGYSTMGKKLLKCLAVYNFEIPKETAKGSAVGICDLNWDSKSQMINVSYKSSDSLIFFWE